MKEVRKLLTFKQKVLLELIELYINRYGYSPTVRELANLFGVKSTSTIHEYLHKLEEQGYISKHDALPRTIKVLKSFD